MISEEASLLSCNILHYYLKPEKQCVSFNGVPASVWPIIMAALCILIG